MSLNALTLWGNKCNKPNSIPANICFLIYVKSIYLLQLCLSINPPKVLFSHTRFPDALRFIEFIFHLEKLFLAFSSHSVSWKEAAPHPTSPLAVASPARAVYLTITLIGSWFWAGLGLHSWERPSGVGVSSLPRAGVCLLPPLRGPGRAAWGESSHFPSQS